jgi:hypothetical protein
MKHLQFFDGVRTGLRRFPALHKEMLMKELVVLFMRMESMRGKDSRKDGDVGFQLHLHQARNDRLGNEFMPIDSAVHDEPCGDDGRIFPAAGKELRMQRDFESARDFKEVDIRFGKAEFFDFGRKGRPALIDNISMPARLHEGYASIFLHDAGVMGIHSLKLLFMKKNK